MSARSLWFVVPGALAQRTGGSIYDRRMVDGLRRHGWSVAVTELDGTFPVPDVPARAGLTRALAAIPDGATVVVDFLAPAGMPDVLRPHAARLEVVALVHLLPGDEPFLEPEERDRRRGLEREALGSCAGVIATSPSSADRLVAVGVAPDRIRTVIPGVDPAPFAQGPGASEPPRLLCVASVTPGKGQDLLVRALAELADLPWSCVCAGSRSMSPAFVREVEASIRTAGLSRRITLIGECDQQTIEELLRTSSVFVLPSYHESYGMALTEAMAHGLPIVSTTAGAIPETVPSDAGILVDPGDGGALARALRTLVSPATDAGDPAAATRARLGAAARRQASSLPSWARQAGRFAESIAAFGTQRA